MLTVELVPASSWEANLRSVLRPRAWDRLRKACYAAAGHRCEVCGGKGSRHPVECHEIWSYDDMHHVQTLTGLIALCPTCHQVKHIGRILGMFGPESREADRCYAKLEQVNRWDYDQIGDHLIAAFKQHEERSRHTWSLDLSWLERN